MSSSSRPSVQLALLISALVGVVLGAIAVFGSAGSLVAVATLFGIAIVVSGAFRLIAAAVDQDGSQPVRIAYGVLGVVLVVLGIVVIARPTQSLALISVLIGLSWAVGGIRDAVFGLRQAPGRTRTLSLVAGAIQLAGAVVMLVLPAVGVAVSPVLAGVLLILVSLASLLTLPSRRASRSEV